MSFHQLFFSSSSSSSFEVGNCVYLKTDEKGGRVKKEEWEWDGRELAWVKGVCMTSSIFYVTFVAFAANFVYFASIFKTQYEITK